MDATSGNESIGTIAFDELTIKCDKCSWRTPAKDLDEVIAFHGKPCPQCGEPDVVNDLDKAAAEGLKEMVQALGLKPEAAPQKGAVIEMRFKLDTAPLRKQES
jgi:NAD-dependent SIR2 family protein deacetylase